ncbi:MAG: exopolyphosphatase [Gammaproteobacteria bacterium]
MTASATATGTLDTHPDDPTPDILAAVDLGSNSFHLKVARVVGGQLKVVDRLRESVRLAAGLDEHKMLSEEAMARALDTLGRFGQRLNHLPERAVRAVGTNTLRSARNGEAFRRRAEEALGHRIEVIAGREEARLIYLGVAHGLVADRRRRLVIDIGGGSTELIIGCGFESEHRESLYMGCVNMSRAYFDEGRIEKSRFKKAELAARMEVEPIKEQFRKADWQHAVGCSGTLRAVASVLEAEGLSQQGMTRDGLRDLKKLMCEAGSVEKLALKGLKDERKPVMAGGVAVLAGVCEELGIDSIEISDQALREGLLYDLVGRIRHDDVRDRTVERLCKRYDVDPYQTARVERTALAALEQVRAPWALDEEESVEILSWAARLHEIGLALSHNGYHKHGAYLLANADLEGYSRQEQALLAALVRCHRRKFVTEDFDALPQNVARSARRICVLLRLAVVLHRARGGSRVPAFELCALPAKKGDGLRLRFPEGWLAEHPLTVGDIAEEAKFLADAGFELDVE